MKTYKMPSVRNVRRALAREWRYIRKNFHRAELVDECSDEFSGTDVRLQVYENGKWAIRSGDSSYDQDHCGFWGASCLSYDRQNLTELACDLIAQAAEQAAELEHSELSEILDR